MITNLQTHVRAAGMEDPRYTMHSFRVGGAANHNMDGAAMDVLMEYVEWKSATVARRYVGVTASAAAAGVKCSRQTAFIEADGYKQNTLRTSAHDVSLFEQFARSHAAFPRVN